MAGKKRLPDAFQGGWYWDYMKLSKADWADVYADLYRQVFGADSEPRAILEDARRRLELLKRYRKAGQ